MRFEIANLKLACYNSPHNFHSRPILHRENVMGKGNNSQKNDKKSKKPKQDKTKGMKPAAKR